jgi:hypothetical protein
MDKKVRNKMKRALKKKVHSLIPNISGMSACFKEDSQVWELWLSVDFDVPSELSKREKDSYEDAQKPEVVNYMEKKKEEIVTILKDCLKAEYTHDKKNDFNFTMALPPTFITKRENGVFRLLTQEEREEMKRKFPSLKDCIEYDEWVLENGFYQFIENCSSESDLECFSLKKYAGLRARYTFYIPHKEVEAII